MIVREITKNPEHVIKNFDWFNDYKDTRSYLIRLGHAKIIYSLDNGYKNFLYKNTLESQSKMQSQSETENKVVDLIRSRGVAGFAKYKNSMDRNDLTPQEWIQHLQEELADGLQYAERVKDAAKILDEIYNLLVNSPMNISLVSPEIKNWIDRYESLFAKKLSEKN